MCASEVEKVRAKADWGASDDDRAGAQPESEVERTLGTLASLNPAYVWTRPTSRPPRRSPSTTCTGPIGCRWCGWPSCWWTTWRPRRTSCRRLSPGCTGTGAGCATAKAAIGYLRTAVVNGSRSMLRRRRTARAYVPPDPGTARSAESLAMLSTEHQAVVSALGDLAPRQREVLVLRYYGGLSEAEIAEATGLSKGTVKSTASRAVAKLGDIMRAQS